MSLALSSNDADVIERTTSADEQDLILTLNQHDLEALYELQKSVEYIQKKNCKKVALQFPDYLLPDSVHVTKELMSRTDSEIFLLADTTYGSYDVDEVAASHVNADLIIHYGKSAFTSTPKTDTIFVFGKYHLNLPDVVSSFESKFSEKKESILILLDLNCYHVADDLKGMLHEKYNVTVAHINNSEFSSVYISKPLGVDGCLRNCPDCDCKESSSPSKMISQNIEDLISEDETLFISDDSDSKDQVLGFYRFSKDLILDQSQIFFIGAEKGETLNNLLLQRPSSAGFVYDVRSCQCSQISNVINRKLNQRYFIVEKVKDSKRIGILVGTMGMSGYQRIIKHLKRIIKLSGRRSYVIVVGKPNPAKLANFAEMDSFVLVACPEQTFVDSPRDYYQPIATPYEVEVALNKKRDWGGKYVTDFRELLSGGSSFIEFEADLEDDISLIDGGIRSCFATDISSSMESSTIALTSEEKALDIFHPHSSAAFYAERSWKGLEQNLGQDSVKKYQPGRQGIPLSYSFIDG